MKHAVLILAHKNIEQLNRLISSLDDENLDIYIHLDKKMSEDEIKKINNDSKRVFIINKRYSIYLYTFRMVEATLELIQQAKENAVKLGKEYGYYILLSGQDYPIKNSNDIVEILNKSYPNPFIDTTPWHLDNWVNTSWKNSYSCKVFRYWCKSKFINIENKYIQYGFRGIVYAITIIISKIKQIILGSPLNRINKLGMEAYGGSQWWILPNDMIEEVIKNSKYKKLTKIFKDVGSADETFFQTIIMNGKYSNRVNVNDYFETKQKTLTYTDFYGDNEISSGHPIILTEKDYKKIIQSNLLFARKFDINIDRIILDKLDYEKCIRARD